MAGRGAVTGGSPCTVAPLSANRRDGSWVEGDLREADPELCLWLTAKRPAKHHRLSAVDDSHGPAG